MKFQKNTEELIHQLKSSKSLEKFLNENTNEILDLTFNNYLEQLIHEKNLTKSEIIRNSGLHQTYAYQIFSGKKNPSRDKLLALAFGMNLSVEETQKLLRIATVGVLYSRNKRDMAIIYSLHNRQSIVDCDKTLHDLGETLISVF